MCHKDKNVGRWTLKNAEQHFSLKKEEEGNATQLNCDATFST